MFCSPIYHVLTPEGGPIFPTFDGDRFGWRLKFLFLFFLLRSDGERMVGGADGGRKRERSNGGGGWDERE